MAAFQYANFAESVLASGIAADAVTLTVTGGHGALFPNSGDYQLVLVRNSDGAREIVKCTSRSTDVLTITRAQEGTTGLVLVTSDKVELRVTAEILASYIALNLNNTFTGNNDFSGGNVTLDDLLGATAFVMQGATTHATNKITWTVTDPTAARTITVPDADVNLGGATTSVLGAVELATEAEVETGTSTTLVPSVNSFRKGFTWYSALQTTTSGTTNDITGIPSWITCFDVMMDSISFSGTDQIMIQIGGSGGISTSSYESVGSLISSIVVSFKVTNGFVTRTTTATAEHTGLWSFRLMDPSTDLWICSGMLAGHAAGTSSYVHSGRKVLSETLTQVRLTSEQGSVAFDNGQWRIVGW